MFPYREGWREGEQKKIKTNIIFIPKNKTKKERKEQKQKREKKIKKGERPKRRTEIFCAIATNTNLK